MSRHGKFTTKQRQLDGIKTQETRTSTDTLQTDSPTSLSALLLGSRTVLAIGYEPGSSSFSGTGCFECQITWRRMLRSIQTCRILHYVDMISKPSNIMDPSQSPPDRRAVELYNFTPVQSLLSRHMGVSLGSLQTLAFE